MNYVLAQANSRGKIYSFLAEWPSEGPTIFAEPLAAVEAKQGIVETAINGEAFLDFRVYELVEVK